jgi:hypothetical protein
VRRVSCADPVGFGCADGVYWDDQNEEGKDADQFDLDTAHYYDRTGGDDDHLYGASQNQYTTDEKYAARHTPHRTTHTAHTARHAPHTPHDTHRTHSHNAAQASVSGREAEPLRGV